MAKYCPKCQASMVEGFTLDQTRNSYTSSSWIEGKPEKSFLSGLKIRGRTRIQIASFRCGRCGYLENYAPE